MTIATTAVVLGLAEAKVATQVCVVPALFAGETTLRVVPVQLTAPGAGQNELVAFTAH